MRRPMIAVAISRPVADMRLILAPSASRSSAFSPGYEFMTRPQRCEQLRPFGHLPASHRSWQTILAEAAIDRHMIVLRLVARKIVV